MSNLVIGLVGVALFASVLLYSGVIFGSKLEEGALSGGVSNLMVDMTHAASAVNRYRLAREVGAGADIGTLDGMVTAGYLTAVPLNPVDAAKTAELADDSGRTFAEYGTPALDSAVFSPAYVVISLGTDSLACSLFSRHAGEIARASSASTTSVAFTTGALSKAGCFRTSTASGNIANGDYVAYVRL